MIVGMTASAFTFVQVALRLVGIGSGFVVIYGLLTRTQVNGWTALFLASTVATSVTGFGFPFERLLPSHNVGIISLVALTITIVAHYVFYFAEAWRWIYVVSAAGALCLNVFVGVVQAFLKVPPLNAIAPNQTEWPFLVRQLVVVTLFVVLAIVAVLRFRTESVQTA
jgi:glucose-6-phosphate-specific signal transduction histidine kinase